MRTDGGPSADDITRAAGLELRQARIAAGLTLAQLVERLPSGIRVPTLAGYETGSRSFTVGRFVEICVALGVSGPNLLAAAVRRARVSPMRAGAVIDLHAIARDRRADRAALRRWARHRLDVDSDGEGVAIVEPATVREMAALCGLSETAMTILLEQYPPNS
ncbi:helix-turn-helix domain-containing protein [Actinokineospora fastidiosa]|uniref:HTH cro/C1-type domain-containing protein n=1 Tax=Actinokineospora fastidiosa TaxID=1816 RepID=A0A918LJR7_9PSEU|nr:helix-turn-helix transcriptional regulator [Actinokineospora fastidiosa]GGS57870.1 hypothetical protein GCM10010171_61100 [Actinokineospora fastidiosa]